MSLFRRQRPRDSVIPAAMPESGWESPVQERQGHIPYRDSDTLKERFGFGDLVSHWSLVCNDNDAAAMVEATAERVIDYLGLLPLHPSRYSTTGGALLAAFRSGRHAASQAQHIVWGDPMSSAQRAAAPYWRAAAIIASFFPWISVAGTHCVVADGAGERWNPCEGDVSGWLNPRREARIFWAQATSAAPAFEETRILLPWQFPLLLPYEVRHKLSTAAGNPLTTLGAVLLGMPTSTELSHNLQTVYERSISHTMELARRGDREDLGSQPLALVPVCVAAVREAAARGLAVQVAGGAGLRWPESRALLAEHLMRKGVDYSGEYELLALLRDLHLIAGLDPQESERGRVVLLSDPLIAFPASAFDTDANAASGDAAEEGESAGGEDASVQARGETEPGLEPADKTGAMSEPSEREGEAEGDPMIDTLFSGALKRLAEDIRTHFIKRTGALPEGHEAVWVPAKDLDSYGVPVRQFEAWLKKHGWIEADPGDPSRVRIPHSIDGKRTPCLKFNAEKLRGFYRKAGAESGRGGD